MWGHDGHDAHQSYDDLDEYETDENNQEEEEAEEEEEDPKPTKEELDYLKMREQIKDRIRQKYRKENAKAFGPAYSRDKNGKATTANFGSFFGPSQTVIAPRVIEESRSIRETQHIVAKAPSSFSGGKHVSTSAEVRAVVQRKPHKAVNEIKTKVQTLKSMRDYSFLLSDDADLPSPAKAPAPQNFSNATIDTRSGQATPPPKSKMSMGKPVKRVSVDHILKNSFPRDQPVQTKAGQQKMAPPAQMKAGQQRTAPPVQTKVGQQKMAPPAQMKAGQQRTAPPVQTKVGQQKMAPPARPKPSSNDTRKLLETKGGNGHGHSAVPKTLSHATGQGMVTKKASGAGVSNANIEKMPSSKKSHSSQKDHYYEQKRRVQDVGKAKVLPKQTISPLKPQPSKQAKERIMYENHPEKKPAKKPLRNPFDEDEDDIDDPMSFLRNKLLSRFSSSKYQVDDDDDSDMEANFDEIMREERRSLKIAMREDEEQLRLIEEEERREGMRRELKKRKRMQ